MTGSVYGLNATYLPLLVIIDTSLRILVGNIYYVNNLAKETKYDEIYLTEDNIYLMKAAHDKYVPVDKIDLDLLNKQVLKKTLSQHKLSKEVRETIEKRSDSAIAANNTDAKATLFTTSSTYYTYNGHYMRSDKLYSYGLNTGWEYIEEGTDTAEVADSITGIALSAAGVSNVFVGIVSLGKTVLDFFTDQCDLIITGHRDDFLQMRVVYDDVMQWTYGQIGTEWYLGLVTFDS